MNNLIARFNQLASQPDSVKINTCLRLDEEVVNFFKNSALDINKGYTTLIAETLLMFVKEAKLQNGKKL